MKILIVEDSRTQATVLAQRLGVLGHEVSVAYDGPQALEMIRQSHFPVVITDWMMPQMDGLEFCRRVRDESEGRPYVFLIMLTSKELRHERLEGLEAGADIFLTKPIDGIELGVALKTAGRVLRSQQALLDRLADLERRLATEEETGLISRAGFLQAMERAMARAVEDDLPVSLIRLDLRPSAGGTDGRAALRALGEMIGPALQPDDAAGRLGERGLALLLPGRFDFAAMDVAEQVLGSVSLLDGPARGLAADAGLATWSPGEPQLTPDALLSRAERALALARSRGDGHAAHWAELPEAVAAGF